jgi:predicted nucleic acid-binding protein
VTAVDTSVVVPALLTWHEHHGACRQAARGTAIPAHALLESYSVMTRLPSPHRVAGAVAAELLRSWFSGPKVLTAPAKVQREVVERLAKAGYEGGSVYDGLVGLTAAAAGHRLLTRDQRALRLYDDLGIAVDLIEP